MHACIACKNYEVNSSVVFDEFKRKGDIDLIHHASKIAGVSEALEHSLRVLAVSASHLRWHRGLVSGAC
jgi:hypothetical protein